MAEEKKFWHDLGVGVTTSLVLAALAAIGAAIWKFAPKAWAAIAAFFSYETEIRVWGWFLIGFVRRYFGIGMLSEGAKAIPPSEDGNEPD